MKTTITSFLLKVARYESQINSTLNIDVNIRLMQGSWLATRMADLTLGLQVLLS